MSTPLSLAPLLLFNPDRSRKRGRAIPYGMTMWFQVDVFGVGKELSLGRWSACSSLTMKVKTEAVPDGAQYDHSGFAPVSVEYPEITLERAVSADDSKVLRTWLTEVIKNWVDADEGATPVSRSSAGAAATSPGGGGWKAATPSRKGTGAGYPGTTVRIRLFSAAEGLGAREGHQIAAWELLNAYPVGWSGPALNAKSGDIAIEKLTLAHSGFLHPPQIGAHRNASGRLRLSYEGEALELQFQPADVKLSKSVTIKPTAGVQHVVSDQVTEPGKLTFDFTVRVEGVTAVNKARALLYDWLTPLTSVSAGPAAKTSPGDASAGGEAEVSERTAKKLQLRIGNGTGSLEHVVTLNSVNMTFVRFSTQGVPSRATVALKVTEFKEEPKPTNPTSGGPPGTAVHTVVAGDSLATIAVDAYGSPARWREIADRNGIDDPLRVRNGSTLLLPGSRPR